MRVLIPLPDTDFDTTEVAVPWKLLTEAGHTVVFATEKGGTAPECDPLLLSGVLFGKLGAAAEPVQFYRQLQASREFNQPVSWCDVPEVDALLLPGGHAPGMRQYLGSSELRAAVGDIWAAGKPVAAICHGVLVLARTTDAAGASVLAGRRTTCLPKAMERSAYLATAWRLGKYYRTYPDYVQDEVAASGATVLMGDRSTKRDTRTDHGHAFVVEDGSYVSARWPGDAYLFSQRFIALLSRVTTG